MRVKNLPNIREQVSLKDFNTYRIGGAAAYFIEAQDKAAALGAVEAALEDGMPYALLGGGTNTLVPDEGFDGLVVKIAHKNIEVRGDALYADAGVSMGALVQKAKSLSLSGLEWAAGLPGTLGGAIYGNAGSCGRETKDVVETVEAFDIASRAPKTYARQACAFHYRHSAFKERPSVITQAVLRLRKDDPAAIQARMTENMRFRISHQPLSSKSEGCVFKNVEVALSVAAQKLVRENPDFSQWKESAFLSAGFLIDKAGLKNMALGGAKISERHANFMVNEESASARDIIGLIARVQSRVHDAYGIVLEEELRYL
ncbi:UDP-N-acetylenolpyruvoylglucosamine reductase [Candidatus Azambacteria bacterium RIFCSPHIGHO2_02_FULL_52_12]|uniref:UDP-N-acetylenolpyruvoylglucosamine reductase n=1 Tax=Candidatus Azambacteria bacterium RIFCSPLOWO2_01_FULL_46_25 TaxID=1797298 RepID=A0A1F5BTA2_9BACT|nr:MAG: UDP-N-acetylenolpyruvoylglucosamine reductase [Candidatus Azambacteria bacterium RIFCSPHIGHO2_02_FULL_52_12]OGD33870.1 MAG: UDP-N-acetylenolpyruvoylglucosamine reductase [Candidatus Azambacteria bacterium RIFCSPLOWO2_01_FULL_46_25]OGD36803.1 MAG: UDP-N-acetylenolpyruvoylglucosamine reductase [Candidatus Azambacteria bacterium RIFCSPHIGHO2_01_FULL_51_74]